MTTADRELIAAWCRWQRAGGTPSGTVRVRRDYLRRLGQDHPHLPRLTTEDLVTWLAGHDWSPNTRKSARSALAGFYRWAEATGRAGTNPATGLPAVRVPRGRPRPAPEVAYRAALARADARQSLGLQLAGRCGLRLGEIARAHTDHVEPDLAGHSIRVTGKGGHTRLVPLPEDLAEVITARPSGWLFPSPAGGHLTPNWLGKVLTECLPDGLTTHTLRHRCATVAYAHTRDLRAVQELLGHARPETTAAYTAVPDDAVRAAMRAAAA